MGGDPIRYADGVALSRDEQTLFVAEDGKVVADLQDPTGAYPQTTGLTETADRLCVQNLHLRVLGWMAR